MSAYLTWLEARDLALSGTPVRRDSWPFVGVPESMPPLWLERRTGLWVLTDARHSVMRVVDASWFSAKEFFAGDWTTDAPGTVRDVCGIEAPKPLFQPPGILLPGELDLSTITLHADIGGSLPDGVYMVDFFLDGQFMGTLEANTPGRYTISSSFIWGSYTTASRIRAWIDVRSSLPLPAWSGHAEWEIIFPAPSYFTINLGVEFIDYPGFIAGTGWLGSDKTFGPYSDNRWIYSHVDDGTMTAQADDDLAINGVLVDPNGVAGYVVPGGATQLLLFLPAGMTFTMNIWNSGGFVWGHGLLRLYNRPI